MSTSGKQPRPAYVEEFDEERQAADPSTKRSANLSPKVDTHDSGAKRARDELSDSGYSSHTRATVEAIAAAQRHALKPDPDVADLMEVVSPSKRSSSRRRSRSRRHKDSCDCDECLKSVLAGRSDHRSRRPSASRTSRRHHDLASSRVQQIPIGSRAQYTHIQTHVPMQHFPQPSPEPMARPMSFHAGMMPDQYVMPQPQYQVAGQPQYQIAGQPQYQLAGHPHYQVAGQQQYQVASPPAQQFYPANVATSPLLSPYYGHTSHPSSPPLHADYFSLAAAPEMVRQRSNYQEYHRQQPLPVEYGSGEYWAHDLEPPYAERRASRRDRHADDSRRMPPPSLPARTSSRSRRHESRHRAAPDPPRREEDLYLLTRENSNRSAQGKDTRSRRSSIAASPRAREEKAVTFDPIERDMEGLSLSRTSSVKTKKAHRRSSMVHGHESLRQLEGSIEEYQASIRSSAPSSASLQIIDASVRKSPTVVGSELASRNSGRSLSNSKDDQASQSSSRRHTHRPSTSRQASGHLSPPAHDRLDVPQHVTRIVTDGTSRDIDTMSDRTIHRRRTSVTEEGVSARDRLDFEPLSVRAESTTMRKQRSSDSRTSQHRRSESSASRQGNPMPQDLYAESVASRKHANSVSQLASVARTTTIRDENQQPVEHIDLDRLTVTRYPKSSPMSKHASLDGRSTQGGQVESTSLTKAVYRARPGLESPPATTRLESSIMQKQVSLDGRPLSRRDELSPPSRRAAQDRPSMGTEKCRTRYSYIEGQGLREVEYRQVEREFELLPPARTSQRYEQEDRNLALAWDHSAASRGRNSRYRYD